MLALDFPKINEILRWQDIFTSFNKVALIGVLATIIGSAIFLLAGSKDHTVAPKGIRNLAEIMVEFIEESVVMQTMGKKGLKWTPFLLSLFVFIYLCNVPGIIPVFYMPATARIAVPLFLSLLVWIVFILTGLKHQKISYFTHLLWPPGVPVALKPLVGLIEFFSTIIVRPLSLTVRLFANMLAGHILLVTFSLLSEAMFQAKTHQPFLNIGGILPFFMLIFLTGFEVLVGFLQAYIFAILTAVYIGTSIEGHGDEEHSPEHAAAH